MTRHHVLPATAHRPKPPRADSRRAGPLRRWTAGLADDRGAATAEYAIATMAAVGFAGLLVVILRSEEVRAMLTEIVRQALSIP